MNLEEARVYLHKSNRSVAILCENHGTQVSAIVSDKSISYDKMDAHQFMSQYMLTANDPAKAASTLLRGTRKKSARAEAVLTQLSSMEILMSKVAQELAAAEAAKPAKAPKAPKIAKEPAAPKEPKAPKAPKLDADGNPVVATTKKWDRPVFKNTQVFATKADANPKRAGTKSAQWFDDCVVGETVQQAMDKGVPRAEISWNLHLGLFTLAPEA